MHVFLERTGGFAGIKLKGQVDSSTLPLRQARRIEKLFQQSRFFELPSTISLESQGADHFHYTITVETGESKHTIAAYEAAIPAELRPFLDFLIQSIIKNKTNLL
jgi:hypothetical protein